MVDLPDPAPHLRSMDQTNIAQAVSLALAPIFLLAGIGALLNVMTARLGRVVDRARHIEGLLEAGEGLDETRRHRSELKALGQRITAANRAIYATTASALLVCFVVALLFVEQLTPIAVTTVVAVLFIATMTMLVIGLGFFLREISVANRSLRVRTDLLG